MNDSGIPAEIEAKLLVPRAADQRAIGQLTVIGEYAIRRGAVAQLYSQYLDTADFALTRSGMTLRVRRHGGRWEATVKWAGSVSDAVHERPELNVPLPARPSSPFSLPAGELHTRLSAVVAGRELQTILVSQIRRRLSTVTRAGAAADVAVAEMALDHIRLFAADRVEPATRYCELEIESVNEQRGDVAALARLLRDRFQLSPSPETKFTYGMKLLYGPQILEQAQTRLLADDTLAAAVKKITAQHLKRLRDNDPGTRIGQNPEALHDMRVAVRRLRALLRAFPDGFSKTMGRILKRELHWLGGVLGAVRDLDVQLDRLQRDRAAAPPRHRSGLDGLQRYLLGQRQQERSVLLAALDSQRYLRLLRRLEAQAMISTRGRRGAAAAPAAEAGCKVLEKSTERLIEDGDQVGAVPAPEALHRLRIRAKRTRYVLEFLSDLAGKPAKQLVKRLVRLQDLLGRHHDAIVAADVVQQYVDAHGADETAGSLLALGALVSSRLRDAELASAAFAQTWQRFRRKRVRREMRAVLRRLDGLTDSANKKGEGSRRVRRAAAQTNA